MNSGESNKKSLTAIGFKFLKISHSTVSVSCLKDVCFASSWLERQRARASPINKPSVIPVSLSVNPQKPISSIRCPTGEEQTHECWRIKIEEESFFKCDKIKHSWSSFLDLYTRCQLEPWSGANLILFTISLTHTQMSQVLHYPNSLIRTDWCSLSPEMENSTILPSRKIGFSSEFSLSLLSVITVRGTVAVLQTVCHLKTLFLTFV